MNPGILAFVLETWSGCIQAGWGSDLWLSAVVLWNSASHVSTMLRSNLDLPIIRSLIFYKCVKVTLMMLLKFWKMECVRLCFAATTLCFSGVTMPNSAFIWVNEHSDARATGQNFFPSFLLLFFYSPSCDSMVEWVVAFPFRSPRFWSLHEPSLVETIFT